jgi:hypothetical protein
LVCIIGAAVAVIGGFICRLSHAKVVSVIGGLTAFIGGLIAAIGGNLISMAM